MMAPSGLVSVRDMLEINAMAFVNAIMDIRRFGTIMELDLSGLPADIPVSDDLRPRLKNTIAELCRALEILGARAALVSAQRLDKGLDDPRLTYKQFGASSTDIDLRLRDEMAFASVFALSAKDVGYFEPPTPLFGDAVANGYPAATYDIAEAGKCLALGRSTASAFHSMRVVEIAIRAVARCLQIPDPLKPADRNWGNVLKSIKAEIDRRWPTAAEKVAGDGHTFEGLFASLDAMKNPWRNATMHVEAIYTEQDAEDMFRAVGAFMRKLAARCDQDGLPGL